MRFFSLLALFLPATAAAEAPDSAKLMTDPLRESVQTEVSVSGNVIVGVMTLAAADAITENQIVVQWAADSADNANTEDKPICLRVASRDGIYTSRNDYAVPNGESRPIHLPYVSNHAQRVKPYVTDHKIALAATKGDCNSGGSKFFLVSRQELTKPSEVVIYLNSFGATDVFYKLGKNDDEPCEYVTEGRRTTYDYICNLGFVTAGEELQVTISRERFGRGQPSIDIEIVGAMKVDAPQ